MNDYEMGQSFSGGENSGEIRMVSPEFFCI